MQEFVAAANEYGLPWALVFALGWYIAKFTVPARIYDDMCEREVLRDGLLRDITETTGRILERVRP